jgi:ATP-dependent exoDNAse (exonuclease V) beta subunit
MKFKQVLEKRKAEGRPFDEEQEAAICHLGNCVVAAGAGAGKTTVLSYRFLYLVMEQHVDADRILTLTFTRKAAGEMHDRIHSLLVDYRDDPQVALQLSKFPDATISTFDAFCAQIVRMDSIRYGIPKDFTIDDDKAKDNALRCCRRFVETEQMEAGFAYLSSCYRTEDLFDNLLIPMASNGFFLPFSYDPHESAEALVAFIRDKNKESEDRLYELVSYLADIVPQSEGKTVLRIIDLAEKATVAFQNGKQEFQACLDELYACRAPGSRSKDADVNEIFKEFKNFYPIYSLLQNSLSQSDNLEMIFTSLEHYQQALAEEKRRSGILTFADVAGLALDILKKNKAIRQMLKKKFSYIMIDEFQDDNDLQKQMLYLLSEKLDCQGDGIPEAINLEPKKLFFVGDEKQSIYRFRGADVSVFKSLAKDLQPDGSELSIARNYRSEPALIDFINQIFPFVMKNGGESYEADFKPLGHRAATPGIVPQIGLLVKPYEKSADADVELAEGLGSEALAVAKKIRSMLEGDDYLIPDGNGGTRRPHPSDIAILMDKLTNQMAFEKALRRYNIPYAVVANKSMMLEAMANDIYAMLQLLLFPDDRLAYAAVLRGPFCKVSDQALEKLLDEGVEAFSSVEGLDEDDAARYTHLCLAFAELKRLSHSRSIVQLISYLWWDCGLYMAYTCNKERQPYLSSYDFFNRLARQSDEAGHSLSHFLDRVRLVLGSAEKLGDVAIYDEQSDAVQLMTIHKSKGLQFPIVILAAAGSSLKVIQPAYVLWHGIPVPAHFKDGNGRYSNILLELHKDQEFQQLLAERKRLFYVAVTRAEFHLVITGTFTKNNRNLKNERPDDSFLLMLLSACGIDKDTLEGGISAITEKTEIPQAFEKELYTSSDRTSPFDRSDAAACLAWYEVPEKQLDLEPVRVAATSLGEKLSLGGGEELPSCASDAIVRELQEAGEKDVFVDFGTYCHAVVESAVLNMAIPSISDVLPASSALYGIRKTAKGLQIEKDALAFSKAFLDSALYKEELADCKLSCEVKFFSALEDGGQDKVVEGAIDLLAEDDEEWCKVIDFKTDANCDPARHQIQLLVYLLAVSRLYPGKRVKGAVVYLRQPERQPAWLILPGFKG